MIRAVAVVLLVAHALVHFRIWVTPPDPENPPPFSPSRSWALSAAHVTEETSRAAATGLAVVTALLYAIAGVALLADAGWWAPAAVVAAAGGLVLKVVWFDPWLLLGIALDAGIILAVTLAWPASLY
ncbi:hypothetical protein [Streptomyces sp. DH37]|uniref:hypothetical protein n=1 Tax=Streptomyces sp. DH37 TaxID=3040122 RepID=UPI002441891E|nr:hypothetical protein [Streptomyces sp. DH37]MDG9701613.1 hypothetical protein [Streptomyces sp. DH37]